MTDVLHVLLDGALIGEVRKASRAGGTLSFVYDEAWRQNERAIPLSLSMPLAEAVHRDQIISAYMAGLLPDNENTLKQWGERFHVSWRSPFALLEHVGEDCAGAVQFVTGDRLVAMDQTQDEKRTVWLSDEEIGQRIADLRHGVVTGRRLGDPGQFSLAGAQAKTALLHDPDGNRWGVPTGRVPTTHILKPPMPGFSGHAENEHFCLVLARKLGMAAAASQVLTFAGETVIVVRRYDRVRTGEGHLRRVHQEDICQALGLPPDRKYEQAGGPGILRILAEVIPAAGRSAPLDALRFLEGCAYNFLIAGTDAHAKNFSMLLSSRGARLAPFYDLASILPHLKSGEVQMSGGQVAGFRDLKLAMKVDSKYPLQDIMPRHWEALARKARLATHAAIDYIRHQIAVLPDLAADVAAECAASGLSHPIIQSLPDCIAERAADLKPIYGSEALSEAALPR
ncbi:type II toxin-antitoxin system HipA family toxin [Azospirillum cavernae]|uniref:Type II toxin-antitoxin system HipA family toxin n=1 Tax=Azospirillum cavernae TaxID=2320860 RepID=A0A418VJZ9_9PROT|nr:type II toxin-antitoxin system HipA family toxin [Azospirillum cavernae]RJF76487.1 type II toxin-antitoxin system HipA family toxin [Azospirillum cavernae]